MRYRRPLGAGLMTRRILIGFGALVLALLMISVAEAQRSRRAEPDQVDSEPPPPVPLQFVEALRERGYFDVAEDYLDGLRDDPNVASEVEAVIDYELGLVLLDQAGQTADIENGQVLLDRARRLLETFSREQPDHPRADEALIQLARLLTQRGLLSLRAADRLDEDSEVQAKREEARASFDRARTAFDRALRTLRSELDSFDKVIPQSDPNYARRIRVRDQVLRGELQRTLVDYEEALSYPQDDPDRVELLTQARETLADIHNRFRIYREGFVALVWQAKCYDELGQYGQANGIYRQILKNGSPELASVRRRAAFFQIQSLSRRGQHALAADNARRWLNDYAAFRQSVMGLAVQLELAKSILAQQPEIRDAATRARALTTAVGVLEDVVSVYSPSRAEALDLLQRYRPDAALDANQLDELDYDEAMALAQSAVDGEEWERAVELLQVAVQRVDPEDDPEQADRNRARYLLAVAYYRSGQYYRAAVLAEHLARRYPEAGLAADATQIAMAAYNIAYNTYTDVDRVSDLNRMVAMAEYTLATFPETVEALEARMVLGQVRLGQGRYLDAIAVLEPVVEPDTPDYLQALSLTGKAQLREARRIAQESPDESAQRVTDAITALQTAYQERIAQGIPPDDPKVIDTVLELAEARTESGQAEQALTLLGDLAEQTEGASSAADQVQQRRVLTALVRAQIGAERVQDAVATLRRLEETGLDAGQLNALYFQIGRLLQNELDRLKRAKEGGQYARIRSAYQRFLKALVEAEGDPGYDVLQWAGEALLQIEQPRPALRLFQRILRDYRNDSELVRSNRILRTQLKQIEALRAVGQLDEARSSIEDLIADRPRLIDLQFELGRILEAQAEADPKLWTQAFTHWRRLTLSLQRIQPRPAEYFEAWYHVARVLEAQGKRSTARQALINLQKRDSQLGNPEIKTQIEEMIRRLGR